MPSTANLHGQITGNASSAKRPTMHYGKKDVFVYRTYAKPLKANKQIPESNFQERKNVLFGVDVQVALHGEAFLKNYTEGDNTDLVATDSMRNFIELSGGKIEYSTIDGFLFETAKGFLKQWPQIEQVDLAGQSVEFDDVAVEKDGKIENSGIMFRPRHTERPRASVSVRRNGDDFEIVNHISGITDIHLMKITGSAFKGFVQDEYTQLPEKEDRNLFIYVDIDWTYNNPEDGANLDTSNYVPAEQIRDIAATVFHELKNNSIQHLVYHIGLRILERFPQLKDVTYYTNNRTLKEVSDTVDGKGMVYTEPTLPYGFQAFTVTRDDLK
ncbi:urate oxidase [Aciduricibacillus chroicocephali]|uniref:Uricase n=1 Tax=Aciduricibacillus chroicocephali TaxID=3054939 RepID=A0ABY9KWK1_9BACI|nr:urate oxidase [Bacillaceae bacterium 44XB]